MKIKVVDSRYEAQLGGDHGGTVWFFNDGSAAFKGNDLEDYWAKSEDALWEGDYEFSIPGTYQEAIRKHNV